MNSLWEQTSTHRDFPRLERDVKTRVLIIGGGMAYTFIKALGGTVGDSLLEEDKVEYAKEMIFKASQKGVKFLLPIDTVIVKEFKNDALSDIVPTGLIPDGWMGVDIGIR